MVQVGDADHRRAGHDHFAQFGLAHGDHAVERREQGGVAVYDARQRDGLLAVVHARLRHFDVALGDRLEGTIALEHGTRTA